MQVWDFVTNPIRGKWLVVDMYESKVAVRFENKSFWLNVLPIDLLKVIVPFSNRELAIEIAERDADKDDFAIRMAVWDFYSWPLW